MGGEDVAAVGRAERFKDVRRVVIKLGTQVVTVADNGLNEALIDRLAEDVAGLLERRVQVAIVSSGAVGAGMGRLGIGTRPQRLADLQAAAAVGQGLLMNAYNRSFAGHDIPVGQVLLTSDDVDSRRRYVNAQNTLDLLFRLGSVPVVNENDSVAVEELQLSVGENDRLSALVAHMIDADLLISMTDVDGLYSGDPGRDGTATLIREVPEVTPDVVALAGKSGSATGRGGMRTKLLAALSVTRGGRMMLIVNGLAVRIADIFAGRPVGTLFLAPGPKLSGRKLWLANSRARGAVVVDRGAVRAVGSGGKSLLPSGILGVVGEFEAGDLIGVEDETHAEIARGVSRYGSREIRKILGRNTREIKSILEVDAGEEVVHRDDLVVL